MQKSKTLYHERLRELMDTMAHTVYNASENFPRHEQFGLISQYRRAAVSVVLNYIEGYARQRKAVLKQFLEISYGSAKESKYLTNFSYRRKYISDEEFKKLEKLIDEICKMLWGILNKL